MTTTEISIDDAAFAVVDVETTGLGPTDRIIEVACVRLEGWAETGRFQSLLNPGMPIPTPAREVSGIDDAMVQAAPIFPEVAPRLEQMIAGAVFVAHNAPFDLSFLSRERKRWKLPPWKGPVLDTLRLARNLVTLPSYSLGDLRTQLHLEHTPSHRALDDVLATASLLRFLTERLAPDTPQLGVLLQAQEPHPLTWDEGLARGLRGEILRPLSEAAAHQRIVELDYESQRGVSVHWMRPVRLEHNGPLYYVRALHPERGDERVFRMDRILAVRVAGHPDGD